MNGISIVYPDGTPRGWSQLHETASCQSCAFKGRLANAFYWRVLLTGTSEGSITLKACWPCAKEEAAQRIES